MIRLATEQDLDALLAIEDVCFTSKWTKDMFKYEISENEFGKLYVLEDNDELVGYIDFWLTFDCCQLANIAIKPDRQGHGYSKQLMDVMFQDANESECETCMLEVRPSNDKARGLYQSYGFIEINIRKGYYNDNGEDAIVMCKPLGGCL